MPELPDVEVFKQYLDSTSLHQNIAAVDIFSRQILKGVSSRKLKEALRGNSLKST